jgi:hypothetical protein
MLGGEFLDPLSDYQKELQICVYIFFPAYGCSGGLWKTNRIHKLYNSLHIYLKYRKTIILFTYCIFNDAVSSSIYSTSDHTDSNGGMTVNTELDRTLNHAIVASVEAPSLNLPGGKKNWGKRENPQQGQSCPALDSNRAPADYRSVTDRIIQPPQQES